MTRSYQFDVFEVKVDLTEEGFRTLSSFFFRTQFSILF